MKRRLRVEICTLHGALQTAVARALEWKPPKLQTAESAQIDDAIAAACGVLIQRLSGLVEVYTEPM